MKEKNKIYSNIDKNILICSYINKNNITKYRTDLSPDEEIMQGSARILEKGLIVEAHKHNPISRNTTGTQEAWIIISGKIKATLYDINDEKINDIELNGGDAIIFYRGGHSLTVLEDNTIFYEFKNGPYKGYKNDKKQIK